MGKSKVTEAPAQTSIVQAPPENALAKILGENNEAFLARYGKELARVSAEMPTPEQLQKILDAIPEEFADKISDIIRRATGKKKGVYSQDSRPDLPELRIYHGTGNDQNRPENLVPGHYYLTTKENVGNSFMGAVLLIYAGRTMWGSTEGGETLRMPICSSMDRQVGTAYGECASCPHRPWKDGQQQKCADDVVAYMLSKDLRDIVVVRFAKTSQPTGQQLLKFVKRSQSVWSKWFKIGSEARTAPQDRNRRWFVMTVEPVDKELVPNALHPFCDAMCTVLEASAILPGIAAQYKQAKQLKDDDTSDLDDKEESDYGDGVTSAPDENM